MAACFDVLPAQPKTVLAQQAQGKLPWAESWAKLLPLLSVGGTWLQGRGMLGASHVVSLQTGLEGVRKIQPQKASDIECGRWPPLPTALFQRCPRGPSSSDDVCIWARRPQDSSQQGWLLFSCVSFKSTASPKNSARPLQSYLVPTLTFAVRRPRPGVLYPMASAISWSKTMVPRPASSPQNRGTDTSCSPFLEVSSGTVIQVNWI